MKRRSMKFTKRQKARGYAAKIKLKTNGHSRSPRWMWWCENASSSDLREDATAMRAVA
jgi:hypothetical protein